MRRAGRIVFGVLIASVVVAMLLAFQAITAARSRQAVSEAMLRQYAQLAASEFARIARRDIETDRKSTRLNSSHLVISYAVFCLKKKTNFTILAHRPFNNV